MKQIWHKLDENHRPVPCTIREADALLGDAEARCVGLDDVAPPNGDPVRVSTVFLVLDNSYGFSTPQWFETGVSEDGGENWRALGRYETWEQALAGHAAIVERIRAGLLADEDEELEP